MLDVPTHSCGSTRTASSHKRLGLRMSNANSDDERAETKRKLSALIEQLSSEDDVKDVQKALHEHLATLRGRQQTESQQSARSIESRTSTAATDDDDMKSKLSTSIKQLDSEAEVQDIEKALHEVLNKMRQNLEKLLLISTLHAARIKQVGSRAHSPSDC